ncbi:orotidine-5'-phosphate decarboxylase [Magnetococcales bacterium HHB-1]
MNTSEETLKAQARAKLCLALDVETLSEAVNWTERLSPWIGLFKVGFQLFTREGPAVVRAIQKAHGAIFLDLKYHDIPNTVAQAARAAVDLEVKIFNIHIPGGETMMRRTAEAVKEQSEKQQKTAPKVLGVTVLTSLSEQDLKKDGVTTPLKDIVIRRAMWAKACGLDGVVCSSQEISAIKTACGDQFTLLTPGIRPAWSQADDQKRIMTPEKAVAQGVDHMVVGRPLTQAKQPEKAAEKLFEEVFTALKNSQ